MIVTPTPGTPQDSDLFEAPAPDEFFSVKSYVDSLDEPTFTEQVVALLPVFAGIAAGVVLGIAATLIVLRVRQRRKPLQG